MEPSSTKRDAIAKLIFWGRKTYRMTPAFLRFVFAPVKLAYVFVLLVRRDQWVLTGKEVNSNRQLAIAYWGTEQNKNYFAKLAFGKVYVENHIGKRWIWQASRKPGNHDCALTVSEIRKGLRTLFQKKGQVYIPQWINLEVDLSRDIASLIDNESLKSDLRRIKKNRLDFEINNDVSQYRDFYENMYASHLSKAYGNMAAIGSYRYLEKVFPRCDMLFIKKEGKYIAGIGIRYKNHQAGLYILGVKDGARAYVEDGAIGALYYYSFRYLREKGYRKVSLGGARAFLKDGLLRYKNKWHPGIQGPSGNGFLLGVNSVTEGVQGFLVGNPFVYLEGTKLNGAIFADNTPRAGEETPEAIKKKYFLEGLSGWFVYRIGEGGRGITEAFPPQFSDAISTYSMEKLFGFS